MMTNLASIKGYKKTGVQGWETVEDVAEWWKEPDMLLVVNNGDYKLVDDKQEV